MSKTEGRPEQVTCSTAEGLSLNYDSPLLGYLNRISATVTPHSLTLTHSLTHSLTHQFTPSLPHSSIHSLPHSLTHPGAPCPGSSGPRSHPPTVCSLVTGSCTVLMKPSGQATA